MQVQFRAETPLDTDRAPEVVAAVSVYVDRVLAEMALSFLKPTKFDLSSVIQLWTTGAVKFFTLNDGGKIVGLQMWAVSPYMWDPGQAILTEMLMYTEPAYRGGAAEFLSQVETDFRKTFPAGTQMFIETGTDNPNINKLKNLGFTPLLLKMRKVL